MINEIKEALDKATPRWHYNGNEIVSMDNTRVGIGGFMTEEDNHLAANAPEWLNHLIGEVERLENTLNEIKPFVVIMQDTSESPSLIHNTGNFILHKIDQALRGEQP